jgi:nitrogen PTS system EIIA component
MPSLSLLLTPETIVEVDSGDRDAALAILAAPAAKVAGVEPDKLLAAIKEREKLVSTGFGGGVAMPHVRLAGVRKFFTALGRTRAGIDFNAADGKPVHLLLLVVGPEADRDGYQKLMARAAKFLKAEGPRLIDAPDLSAAVTAVAQEY